MRISIFGLGYVGSILSGCLAQLGHTVIGLDTNPVKTTQLGKGMTPVEEPGLAALIADSYAAGRIHASDDPMAAVLASDLSLICVGTPAKPDGSPDDRQLRHAVGQIAAACRTKPSRHLIVVRSTALPATHDALLAQLHAAGQPPEGAIGYVVHPEFLREGSGVMDFFDPAIILYGGSTMADRILLDHLYPGIDAPVHHVDRATAALAKYASNLYHAVKVVFANEINRWAAALDADGQAVMELLTADHKLNLSSAYLRPGLPFGGGCLPKDLAAALRSAEQQGLDLPLFAGVDRSNRLHGEALALRLTAFPQADMLMVGLAFKPGTDDLRESPLVLIVRRLLDKGKALRIYAPEIALDRLTGANLTYANRQLPELSDLLVQELSSSLSASTLVLAGRPLTIQEAALVQASRATCVDLAYLLVACAENEKGDYHNASL